MLVPKTSGLTRDLIGPSYLLQGRGLVSRGAKRPPGGLWIFAGFPGFMDPIRWRFSGSPKAAPDPIVIRNIHEERGF